MMDTQLMHSTRFSIPGAAFRDEPGWYVNIGPEAPQSVGDEWFTVVSLIARGR